MSRGAAMIVKERDRQKREEGFDTAHDDEHSAGEMIDAAYSYLSAVQDRDADDVDVDDPPMAWPWSPDWWKPKDDIRDLVRAGALIAAEIDRRLRAADQRSAKP